MNRQKVAVFHESASQEYEKNSQTRIHGVFTSLKADFHFEHIYDLRHATQFIENHELDLVIFYLKKYRGSVAHPLAKLRKYFKNLPLLIFCDEMSRDARIEIHRHQNIFAFDLSLESHDIVKYLNKFCYRHPKARSFVRFNRSRILNIEFENQKHTARFIDYSQTGAQIQTLDFQPRPKSRVLVTYESKSTRQIRQIESYVVWVDGINRIGLQFLAVR